MVFPFLVRTTWKVFFISKEVRIVNPLEVDNWNQLILEHEGYSFFHTREWAHLLNFSYGYESVYFCIFDGEKLSSLIPSMRIKSFLTGKQLVSLPFSDVSEPFIEHNDDADELLETMILYCKNNNPNSMEFRASETEHFRTDLGHVLKIDKTGKEIFKSFSENTKRNIKKSQKENVIIKLSNGENGIRIFDNLKF